MALRPFSIVGDALNFSATRFETVMRVSIFPIVLLLIFEMAASFAYLSLASGEAITFKHVAEAGANWSQVRAIASGAAQQGLASGAPQFWAIFAASGVINAILVAAFMAPLVRYAGLGERPRPGVLRAPFGADQFRYLLAGALSALIFALIVYAPISIAAASIISFIGEAMTTPFARFPDPESIHTIDIVAGAETFGVRWFNQYAVWIPATLIATLALAGLLVLHLRPRAEDRTAGIGLLGRVLGVLAGVAMFMSAAIFIYVSVLKAAAQSPGEGGAMAAAMLSPDSVSAAAFFIAALAYAAFFSLRLFPYVGIAVCRRSMSLKGALSVTRRFDVLRLALALVVLGIILFLMQLLLVILGGGAALAAIGAIAQAVESYVRLVNGAEASQWVFPFFGWLWAVIGIAFTILWTAFTYGVTAGLWGRLYRDVAGG